MTPSTLGAAPRLSAKKLSRSKSTVTWCSRAVNRNFLSFLAASRTWANLLDQLPRFFLGQQPSLHCLRWRFPALFGCFAGTMPLSDSSSPCMWDLSLIAFSHRTTTVRISGRQRGLSVLARGVSMHAGSLTPQGCDALALTHAALLPSSLCDAVGFSPD